MPDEHDVLDESGLPTSPYDPDVAAAGSSARVQSQIGPYRPLGIIGKAHGASSISPNRSIPSAGAVLKIIKPGMDSRQVIAWFEAERRALALMDHPNVARVSDAGATASGRLYFTMELVAGTPITR
jgi:hypothetical protein